MLLGTGEYLGNAQGNRAIDIRVFDLPALGLSQWGQTCLMP
jgi:hypothetical protein